MRFLFYLFTIRSDFVLLSAGLPLFLSPIPLPAPFHSEERLTADIFSIICGRGGPLGTGSLLPSEKVKPALLEMGTASITE
jgi:hypothetical protein